MTKREEIKTGNNQDKELKKLQKSKVSIPQLLVSIKSLSALLRASIPLADTVETISEQSTDENLNKIYKYICHEIREGETLAEAMSLFPKVFSETIVSVVEAGEKGGSLEKNLMFISETIKKEYELKKKMRSALIYPAIIISLTIVEFLGMIFIVLPRLESLFSAFPNVPPFTVFIMTAAQAIRSNWMIILGGLVLIVLVIKVFLSTKLGNKFTSWLSLNFPILKTLFTSNILSSFSRTLSVLLASGIPLVKALTITSSTAGNYMYAQVLKEARDQVEEGQNLSDSLAEYKKFFNKSFVKMVEVGETSGTLEESLMYLHDYYSEQVDDISNNIVTFVEPLLLIFIGLIIGFLGVTILMPIYQLMGSINA